MNFLHTPTQRMSRLKGILLMCIVATSACGGSRSTDPTMTQLQISPKALTLETGQTNQFVVVSAPRGNGLPVVTWISSNPGVATVSETGGVTGVAAGTATIMATSDGANARSIVTVTDPVRQLQISPEAVTLETGQTTQFVVVSTPADNDLPVTWTSSNLAVATVSENGAVTGVAAGTATITAAGGGATARSAVTVKEPSVEQLQISPEAVTLETGQTAQLVIASTPADSHLPVTWTSSNPAVATVHEDGVVNGVAAGSATITATSGGANADAAVTVTEPVRQLQISPDAVTLESGQTTQFVVVWTPAGKELPVTWASSNPAVATVHENGAVTGVAAGTATITATSGGANAGSAVTVTDPPVTQLQISPQAVTLEAGQTAQFAVVGVTITGQTLSVGNVNWSSSDTEVANVNGSGLVTARAAGAATITATSQGKSGTATAFSVTTNTPPPSAGATEPAFDPATGVSLFYDDFEAYDAVADLTTGSKAKYYELNGKVSVMNSSGNDYAGGAKFARFDYGAAGDYANELYTTQHRNALLNTAKTVVLTYGFRNTGMWFTGKEFIIRDLAGPNRFVLVGMAYFTTPQSLQDCWYSPDYPYSPRYPYVQPRATTPAWSRDGLAPVGGPSPHFLSGNVGYSAVQFTQTRIQLGPKNDGNWHRFTYRFTKESARSGTGRLEGWLDGVKFMEYVGDDPSRCEYGQVWTWSDANTVWNNDLYFVGTTSGIAGGWSGGAVLDMDGVRLWLP
jgi:uncharacterized protein YjdB